MENITKNTLTTSYDLYQLLKSHIGSTFIVSNRARKASTLTIEGNNIHFDPVNGSAFSTYIVKSKYRQWVSSLLEHLEESDANVTADKQREARASLKFGDLDRAFSALDNLIKTELYIHSRVRNGKFERLECNYRKGKCLSEVFVDVRDLSNNTALAYLLKGMFAANSDNANYCSRGRYLITRLEDSFGSWRELKLRALLEA